MLGLSRYGERLRSSSHSPGIFRWLHLQLKEILRAGSQGGTHLADGLRLGIRELAGTRS